MIMQIIIINNSIKDIFQPEEPEFFRPGTLGKIQKCLWDLFEKPHTSLGARVSLPDIRK